MKKSNITTGIVLILIIIVISILQGCAKVVSSETKDIKGTVISTEYRGSYSTTTFIMSGNTMIPITYISPEEYNVTINADGTEFHVDNEEFYNICKGKEDKEVSCKIKVERYDDNEERKNLIYVGE
jgi:hypothetical protein